MRTLNYDSFSSFSLFKPVTVTKAIFGLDPLFSLLRLFFSYFSKRCSFLFVISAVKEVRGRFYSINCMIAEIFILTRCF